MCSGTAGFNAPTMALGVPQRCFDVAVMVPLPGHMSPLRHDYRQKEGGCQLTTTVCPTWRLVYRSTQQPRPGFAAELGDIALACSVMFQFLVERIMYRNPPRNLRTRVARLVTRAVVGLSVRAACPAVACSSRRPQAAGPAASSTVPVCSVPNGSVQPMATPSPGWWRPNRVLRVVGESTAEPSNETIVSPTTRPIWAAGVPMNTTATDAPELGAPD